MYKLVSDGKVEQGTEAYNTLIVRIDLLYSEMKGLADEKLNLTVACLYMGENQIHAIDR